MFALPKLVIGHAVKDDRHSKLSIPYDARAAHLHVIGRTRSGKSRWLADLIRQDIMNGQGVCLLDPHSELYDHTVNWLVQNSWVVKDIQPNIYPIRLADPNTRLHFNPLQANSKQEAFAAARNVTSAITRLFGGRDSTETPLFTYVSSVLFAVLALKGLPLAAAQYFTVDSDKARDIRAKICRDIDDEYVAMHAESLFMTQSGKEFREKVASTVHRLHTFLMNPLMREFFSSTEDCVDLRSLMEQGGVLLIDAGKQKGSALASEDLRMIGSLLVNSIFAAAEERDPRDKPRPFMLYIDEVQNYVNYDIPDILAQAAKRGLYLTLAHQDLAQLMQAGESIYSGVVSNTILKAVFEISMQDADVLADELFADQVDFERVKEKLAVPHVVGNRRTFMHNLGSTTGHGTMSTDATSYNEMESEARTTSQTELLSQAINHAFFDGVLSADPRMLTQVTGQGSMAGLASALGRGRSSSTALGSSDFEAVSESISEALEPIYEWFSTQTESLEEQRYRFKTQLSFTNPRQAYFALGHRGTKGFYTRTVEDILDIRDIEDRFVADLQARAACISHNPTPRSLLEHPRLKSLLAETNEQPAEPDDWFEEAD